MNKLSILTMTEINGGWVPNCAILWSMGGILGAGGGLLISIQSIGSRPVCFD